MIRSAKGCPFSQKSYEMPTGMTGMMRALLLAVLLLAGCALNPASGRKQLNLLSVEQEISLGQEASGQFLDRLGGPIRSEPIRQYVDQVGRELARLSERPDLPWEFQVVDSHELNAFALPGGKIFISRGLLARLDDEAMLAAVLAHEIAHTTARHIGEQMTQKMILQGLLTVADTARKQHERRWLSVLGVGAEMGSTLYLLKFSRQQELEADQIGLRYIVLAGYDPRGLVRVLELLAEQETSDGRLPILATHPDPAERVRRAASYVKRQYPIADDRFIVNADRFDAVVRRHLASLPGPRHPARTASSPTQP